MAEICKTKTFTITLEAAELTFNATYDIPASAYSGEELSMTVTIQNTSNIDMEFQIKLSDSTGTRNTYPWDGATWHNCNAGASFSIDMGKYLGVTPFKMPKESWSGQFVVCGREQGWF